MSGDGGSSNLGKRLNCSYDFDGAANNSKGWSTPACEDDGVHERSFREAEEGFSQENGTGDGGPSHYNTK